MNYLIVTGHECYADGVKGTLEAIAGEQKQIYYINYDTCTSAASLTALYEEVISRDTFGGYLFVCDIAGATPYQAAAMMAIKNPRIHVVGGMNLSAILEVLFHLDLSLEEIAEMMIHTTKQTAIQFLPKKRQ